MTTPTFEPANPEPEPVPLDAALVAPPTATAVPITPVASRPRHRSSRALNTALGAAVVVAVAGVAFAVGRMTAPTRTTTEAAAVLPDGGAISGMPPGASFDPNGGGFVVGGGPSAMGGDGPTMLGAGGPAIEGTVESVTADSITIRLPSGQSVTVGLDSETAYHQQADAEASDVSAGKTVILRIGGGFRPRGSGDGTPSLGTASDVTVVP